MKARFLDRIKQDLLRALYPNLAQRSQRREGSDAFVKMPKASPKENMVLKIWGFQNHVILWRWIEDFVLDLNKSVRTFFGDIIQISASSAKSMDEKRSFASLRSLREVIV